MASGKHGHTIRAAGSTMGSTGGDPAAHNLATAIVHRACLDYLMALRGKTHNSHCYIENKDQIEQFFRSAWFRYLCNADGELIMEALKQMHKRGQKTVYFTLIPEDKGKETTTNGKKHSIDLN